MRGLIVLGMAAVLFSMWFYQYVSEKVGTVPVYEVEKGYESYLTTEYYYQGDDIVFFDAETGVQERFGKPYRIQVVGSIKKSEIK